MTLFLLAELWSVVPGGHYLRDAVWVPPLLLQAPQPDDSQGHEEKDHDRKLRVPRGRVEPDLGNGKRHCEKVSPCRKLWCCSVLALRNCNVSLLRKWKSTWKCLIPAVRIVCSSSSWQILCYIQHKPSLQNLFLSLPKCLMLMFLLLGWIVYWVFKGSGSTEGFQDNTNWHGFPGITFQFLWKSSAFNGMW